MRNLKPLRFFFFFFFSRTFIGHSVLSDVVVVKGLSCTDRQQTLQLVNAAAVLQKWQSKIGSSIYKITAKQSETSMTANVLKQEPNTIGLKERCLVRGAR